jgi:Asp-tRNA(Asn)/Glu-tRNA(Gln) amidotransferase C subunit
MPQRRLTGPALPTQTEEEIMNLVTQLGSIMQALKQADPADKAEVYSRLSVMLTYHPNEKAGQGRSPTRVDHVRRSVSEARVHRNTHIY